MTKQPTRPQRLVVQAADPDTGLLKGTARHLDALVSGGWAVRHPKPPHRCYLSPSGWALRRRLLQPPPAPSVSPPGAPGLTEVFTARTGDEAPPDDPSARERQVRSAWEGLLDLRRMTNRTGETDLPCQWERTHLVAAAGLALEAAGCPPSTVGAGGQRTAGGYRVAPWPQAGTVRIDWAGPPRGREADGKEQEHLAEIAGAMEKAGWQVSEHRDVRGGTRFLLASPRRV